MRTLLLMAMISLGIGVGAHDAKAWGPASRSGSTATLIRELCPCGNGSGYTPVLAQARTTGRDARNARAAAAAALRKPRASSDTAAVLGASRARRAASPARRRANTAPAAVRAEASTSLPTASDYPAPQKGGIVERTLLWMMGSPSSPR